MRLYVMGAATLMEKLYARRGASGRDEMLSNHARYDALDVQDQ